MALTSVTCDISAVFKASFPFICPFSDGKEIWILGTLKFSVHRLNIQTDAMYVILHHSTPVERADEIPPDTRESRSCRRQQKFNFKILCVLKRRSCVNLSEPTVTSIFCFVSSLLGGRGRGRVLRLCFQV